MTRLLELRLVVLALLLASCSAGSGGDKLRVGSEQDADSGGGAGIGSGAGQVGDGGIGSGNEALRVQVQDPDGMTLELITLACAGDCADVEAVARGGNPPYAFVWEDGSTKPKRRVCLSGTRTLTVSATDTGIADEEFVYEAQTVSVDVVGAVLDCSDGGGPGRRDDLCITNGSFDGLVGVNGSAGGAPAGTPGLPPEVVFDASPWQECTKSPDIWDENATWGGTPSDLPASDGDTYLSIYNVLGLRESTGQPLCAPLVAGRTYSFRVDLVFRTQGSFAGSVAGAFEVWAGKTVCEQGQLLFTSPVATSDWQTLCATFTAADDYAYLMVGAAPGSGITGAFVDHIVPVEGCP